MSTAHIFSARGIKVIHVKEFAGDNYPKDTEYVIWHRVSSTYQYLNDAIGRLFSLIPRMHIVAVDIHADDGSISAMYLTNERENSVAVKYPFLLEEWDYDKNGYLKPEYVSSKSNKPTSPVSVFHGSLDKCFRSALNGRLLHLEDRLLADEDHELPFTWHDVTILDDIIFDQCLKWLCL